MKKLNPTIRTIINNIPLDEIPTFLTFLSDGSCAVVVMNLSTDAAAKLIEKIPKKKLTSIVKSLVDIENAEENILNKMLAKVENEILKVIASRYNQINIKETLSALICRLDTFHRTSILETIKEKKKNYYNKLNRKVIEYKEKNNIYFFEDILTLNDEDVANNIIKMDVKKVAIAIKDSTDIMKDKILENMSTRLQEMTIEDMKTLDSITPEEIEEAQSEVVTVLTQK